MRFNNRIQHSQPPDEPIKAVAEFNDPTQKEGAIKFAIPESIIIPRQNEYPPKDFPKALTTANVAAIPTSKPNIAIQTATSFSKKKEDFYDAEKYSKFLINSPTGEKQNLLDSKGPIAANQPAEQLTPLRNQLPDFDEVCEPIDSTDSEPSNDAENEPSKNLRNEAQKMNPKKNYNIRKLTRATHGISFLYLDQNQYIKPFNIPIIALANIKAVAFNQIARNRLHFFPKFYKKAKAKYWNKWKSSFLKQIKDLKQRTIWNLVYASDEAEILLSKWVLD
jgi:hypothetical protein